MALTFNIINESSDENINKLFTNNNIISLLKLYQFSQAENKRYNKLTQEIGSGREKDLIAYMKHVLKEKISYDIPNKNEEDVIMDCANISIKHSSNKKCVQNGIKIHWTTNKESQEKLLSSFIFKCDLLIVYVRFSENEQDGELEIIYVTKELLNTEKSKSEKEIFNKLDSSNSRGIEFTKEFFENIVRKSEFRCIVSFKKFMHPNVDPIKRRLKICEEVQSWSWETAPC